MRTLLVHPNFKERYGNEYQRYFSLGLPYVSSALKKGGLEVDCLNLTYCEDPYQCLSSRIAEGQYDILATTGLSAGYVWAKRLVQAARHAGPRLRIVVGGGMITSQPELIMSLLPIDYGILGEGEQTAVELWKALAAGQDLSRIPGLAYRDASGKIILTAPRQEIADIGTIVWPDYDGFNLRDYLDEQKYRKPYLFNYHRDDARTVHMIASRSCPFSCTFCFRPLGPKYRQRPLDDFFAELEMLVGKYGINTLHLLDDLLTYNRQRLMEFCERIKPFKISWASQARGDGGLDGEAAGLMKDSGCIHFAFGIESASDQILKSLNKKEHFWKIERSLEVVRKAGIPTGGNFIFGDVEENWETASHTMNWWKAHQQYFIDLLFITCYPGSGLYRKAVEKGKIGDEEAFLEQGCPLVNISRMTDDEYLRWNYELQRYKGKYRVFAREIEMSPRPGANGSRFYEMKLRCPKCGKNVRYGNVYKSSDRWEDFVTLCRRCGQYLVVEDPDGAAQLEGLLERLGSLAPGTGAGGLAFFGAGVLAARLLRQLGSRWRPVCIFDNDRVKHGEDVDGVKIAPFRRDSDYLRTVETVVITAPTYKDDIIAQIAAAGCKPLNIAVAEYSEKAGYRMLLLLRPQTSPEKCGPFPRRPFSGEASTGGKEKGAAA